MAVSRARKSGISTETSPVKGRSLTRASGLPSPAKNVVTTITGNTTATLSWEAPEISGDSAITGYEVVGGGTAVVSGTTATITGLSANTLYSFSVIPINSVGRGTRSMGQGSTTTNWNSASASNGTSTIVENWNGTGQRWEVLKFIPSQSGATFTVTNAGQDFRYLVVGGGGGGGSSSTYGSHYGGLGGSGAAYEVTNWRPSLGNYTVTVGNGGGQAGGGQASSFAGTVAPGGTGGANCHDSGCNNGSSGGPGVTSNITGVSQNYPYKTTCCPGNACSYSTWSSGQYGFGGGGHHASVSNCAPPGLPGVVFVAWQIG